MKVAIVGSRSLTVDIASLLPAECSVIISGGAKGIDTCAAEYAKTHGIRLMEFKPDYKKYGRAAPIKRNDLIIEATDMVIAVWDGKSRGTKYVIDRCTKLGKRIRVITNACREYIPQGVERDLRN